MIWVFSPFLASDAPRRPKRAPKSLQDGQRSRQEGPKTAQEHPKTAQEDPKRAPQAPKRPKRGAQTAPKRLQNCRQDAPPRASQETPRGNQEASDPQPRQGGGMGRRPLDPPPPEACHRGARRAERGLCLSFNSRGVSTDRAAHPESSQKVGGKATDASKTAKMASKTAKMAQESPRWPQDVSKTAQHAHNIAQDGLKMAQEAPKSPPRLPKRPPRGHPGRPEEAQISDLHKVFEGFGHLLLFGLLTAQARRSKRPLRQPKRPPRLPRTSQETPRAAPRGLQDGQRWPPRRQILPEIASKRVPRHLQNVQDAPKRARDGARCLQDGPRWTQVGRRSPQDGHRHPQGGPDEAKISGFPFAFEGFGRFFFFCPFDGPLPPPSVPRRASTRAGETLSPIAWPSSGHKVRPQMRFQKARGGGDSP